MTGLFQAMSWPSVAWLAAALFILYHTITAFYTWRRLASIPAPSWIAHISNLWVARVTYSGRQYWVHRDLHKKHGPLVRVGPNSIVTNDPNVIRKITGVNEGWHRDSYYKTGKFNPYHDNLFSRLSPKEHTWAKSRTIAAYSGRETPDLEIGVNELVKTLLEKIENGYANHADALPTLPLMNLGKTSNYFTIDVITRLAFGEAFGYLSEEKDHFNFLASLHDLWPQMSTCADLPILRHILFSPTFLALLGPKLTDQAGFGALMKPANDLVAERFAQTAKPKQDMLGSMIKHGLNQIECETEGLFMIIAGTESTAAAIRSAIIHTITTPRVYQKLKQEIASAVHEGKVSTPITFQEAKTLPYLQAIVYESIRMRPPLIGFFPKVVPPQGENILGYDVPGGTAVGNNMSAFLTSTEYFGPDADTFSPERFMVLEDAERKQMERDVELAFGSGQWMCVGKTIAFMELYKSVFEIFRAFDLQLAQPFAPSDILAYGVFLESNLMVRVTKNAV
ncbi:hypothetical protein DOTSEDRAFT_91489 [Dothistroma septosporum NZE10]|uniref:Pisatin demethylase n=1 Tax=Dothistroma septosporum (strain NZE10 / CBS 128990) TaxID=675120 RepID=N1PDV9_DOTSN|nr:hypothetical protein DOTSEDRAFT_91489 [Dothistroma septosporum NZE10]